MVLNAFFLKSQMHTSQFFQHTLKAGRGQRLQRSPPWARIQVPEWGGRGHIPARLPRLQRNTTGAPEGCQARDSALSPQQVRFPRGGAGPGPFHSTPRAVSAGPQGGVSGVGDPSHPAPPAGLCVKGPRLSPGKLRGGILWSQEGRKLRKQGGRPAGDVGEPGGGRSRLWTPLQKLGSPHTRGPGLVSPHAFTHPFKTSGQYASALNPPT